MSKKRPPVPIFTSPSRRYYLWADMVAAARRLPNTWLFVLPNVPRATVRAVAERRHQDLKNIPGGRLTAEARNTYTDDDGREHCDLFVKFIPEGATP